MTKRRVLITCSAKGGLPYYWFSSYDKLLRHKQDLYDFEFAVESGNNAVNLSRNIAASVAMEMDYWKLLQIDADQFWDVEHVMRILSHDEPIVALPYCKKHSGKTAWLMVKTPGAVPRKDGLLQCDFMGTGMFCTEVDALRKLVKFYPELTFVSEDEFGNIKEMTELFPIGIVGPNAPSGRLARMKRVLGDPALSDSEKMLKFDEIMNTVHPTKARLLGEDYHFCHLATKAGFKLYCDTTCIVGHVGDIVYPVASDMVSKPQAIPTHNLDLNDW